MNNIKITKDNYELYKRFYDIKQEKYCSPKGEKIGNMLGISIFLLVEIVGWGLALFKTLMILVFPLAATSPLIMMACFNFMFEYPYKYTIKQFLKENPDFNINVDIKELELELKKYEDFSKIDDLQKDIEAMKLQEEKFLSKFEDDFKEKSLDEKINTLDILIQEKETLKEVRQYYQTIKEYEEHYQELLTEDQKYESQEQVTNEEIAQKQKRI